MNARPELFFPLPRENDEWDVLPRGVKCVGWLRASDEIADWLDETGLRATFGSIIAKARTCELSEMYACVDIFETESWCAGVTTVRLPFEQSLRIDVAIFTANKCRVSALPECVREILTKRLEIMHIVAEFSGSTN